MISANSVDDSPVDLVRIDRVFTSPNRLRRGVGTSDERDQLVAKLGGAGVTMAESNLDFERLLKLRLIVARFGEMDAAQWWNTKGVLGRKGRLLMSRGFPKTHRFAQARLVFEVARARSAERFAAVPGTMTLWNLPAEVEDQFDARWADWLDDSDSWTEFFDAIEQVGDDLLAELKQHQLLDDRAEEAVSRTKRSAEGRAVALPGILGVDDETMTLLAAAFSRGEVGTPAIPYARLEN